MHIFLLASGIQSPFPSRLRINYPEREKMFSLKLERTWQPSVYTFPFYSLLQT
jgi:hypothetical protein